jgi:hypothetical protein
MISTAVLRRELQRVSLSEQKANCKKRYAEIALAG